MTLYDLVTWMVLPYLVAYYGFQLVMVVVGATQLYRLRQVPAELMADIANASGTLPPVSIIVPAFNEEQVIIRTLESLLALSYPQFEIIVVDDGSDDATINVLRKHFDLATARIESKQELASQRIHRVFRSRVSPRLRVASKNNGGKADALNAGINLANYPLVLAVDADVVVLPDALTHLAIPFVTDTTTVASTGMIRPHNGCAIEFGRLVRIDTPRSLIESVQVVEYLRAYGIGRLFFDRCNAHLIISGAFGLFSRRLLVQVGGYQTHAVGEDMELVVRAHRFLCATAASYRVAFAPDALCLTEVPHSLTELGKQRTRWHQGLLSTLRLHRSMIGRRQFGAAGVLAFPYFVAELFLPIFELLAWTLLAFLVAAGTLTPIGFISYASVLVLSGSLISLIAVLVDSTSFQFFRSARSRMRLVVASLVEPLGYRQFTVFFRLRAFFRYYRGLQLRTAWRPPARMAAGKSGTTAV